MTRRVSLRARLTLVILPPVLGVALIAGLWQLNGARETADGVFNKSMLSAAVAVANDVAISGGDALSPRTRDILSSTSGGQVFYHVFAPDGVIVAGYATPPVGIPRTGEESAEPTFFRAAYLGRDVSGVRLQTRTQIEGFTGLFTTTVWQDSAVREAFVRDLMMRSLVVSMSILVALALIVWFGVRIGLRPLLDLEQAIAQRSSGDLSPIKRAVPAETEGIVATLNSLFDQVSRSMAAQSEFIANAAHQLRNPIAGVLALAESVVSARTNEQVRERSRDLLDAAQKTADLSSRLLMLERAQSLSQATAFTKLDLQSSLGNWLEADKRFGPDGIALHLDLGEQPANVMADPVMLREAIVNLLDNACSHGGPDLSEIRVSVRNGKTDHVITVADNGRGIPVQDMERAMIRFVQLNDAGSTGLGLSIVRAIVEGHSGRISLADNDGGLAVQVTLPAAA